MKEGIRCENCGEKARINIQKIWIKWKYNYKTGSYSHDFEPLFDAEEPVGDNNLHLCEKCFHKWENGEI
ncbi:MAG TPA: hypothetical protein PLQ41_08380 [bacterium]|mgnify:CR=1 FL=1|nr:hypothetical protein [bacterium]HPP30591.1 hypothetical protein [bacterium]